jgi:hypothetical protein
LRNLIHRNLGQEMHLFACKYCYLSPHSEKVD